MPFKLDQTGSVQRRDVSASISFPEHPVPEGWDERTDVVFAAMRWQVKCHATEADHLTNCRRSSRSDHALPMSRRGAIGNSSSVARSSGADFEMIEIRSYSGKFRQ